jgi:hypothetical protein
MKPSHTWIALVLSTLFVSWQQPREALKQPAPQSINLELYRELCGTYGFCVAQELSLSEVARQHGALSPRVAVLRTQFEAVFGSASRRIEQRLAEISGQSWTELDGQLRSVARKQINGVALTLEDSIAFLDRVQARIKGKIESPFIEALLSHHPVYLERPAQEIIDGFKRSYETKGHAKAKGLNVRIAVPLSWASSEGERPNIVQKFKSEGGHGHDNFMIQVKSMPVPDGFNFNKKDIEDMFAVESLKSMVPEGASAIEVKNIFLDGQPGAMIFYEQISAQLDQKMFMRTVIFVTVFGNCMLFLHGSNGGVLDEQDLIRARFKRSQATYALIANSLVFIDNYTK